MSSLPVHLHFINHRRVPSATGETLPMIDPSDGQPFAQIARGTAREIDAAVLAASAAFAGGWGRASGVERGRILARASALVLAARR